MFSCSLASSLIRDGSQGGRPSYKTRLAEKAGIGSKDKTIGDFHSDTLADLNYRVDVPWVLKPAAFLISGKHDVNENLERARAPDECCR